MSRWTPCKRSLFIKKLRQLGFHGPYSGARHEFMVIGESRLTLPSNAEFSIPQLKMMIAEIESLLSRQIDLLEWEQL